LRERLASNENLNQLIDIIFTLSKDEPETSCTICKEEIKPEEKLVTLPCNGSPVFHSKCILDWLKKNNIYPLDNENVSIEDIHQNTIQD